MKPEHCQIEICSPDGQVIETMNLWDLIGVAYDFTLIEHPAPGAVEQAEAVKQPGCYARLTALGDAIVFDVESPRQPVGRDLNENPPPAPELTD